MGKYLLIILTISFSFFLLPQPTFSEKLHEISDVSISKIDGLTKIFVKVSLPDGSDKESKKYIFESDSGEFLSGFLSAAVDGNKAACTQSDTKIECGGIGSEIIYEFGTNPKNIVENRYCKSVVAKKTMSEDESKNYYISFSAFSGEVYRYLHKVIINNLKTERKLSEVHADISSNSYFSLLFDTNSLIDKNETIKLIFSDDPEVPKVTAAKSTGSGEYRPRFGTVGKFIDKDLIETYFLNTNKNKIDVDDVSYVLCDREKVFSQSLKVKMIHKIYDGDTLMQESERKDLDVTYREITYAKAGNNTDPKAEITLTSTPVPVSYTPTPTPTTNVITSANSVTNTPTPTSGSAQVSSASNQSDKTTSKTPESVDGPIPRRPETGKEDAFVNDNALVLGESTAKGEIDAENVSPAHKPLKNNLIFDRNIMALSIFIFLISGTVIFAIGTIYKNRVTQWINSLRNHLSIFVMVLVIVFSARPAAAQMTSIKITDAFTMHGTGLYTGVMHYVFIYPKTSTTPGRYVISRNPDGTGDIQVGNYLQALVKITYFASSRSYYVGPADGTNKHYICPDSTTVPPQDVSAWFGMSATYEILFRFVTTCRKDFPVSDMYLVFIPDPTPTPTATATPTPTPTVAPFLDLPWDYKSKNLTFSQAATAMTSYFDHEYPLLSKSVTGLYDGDDYIINYENVKDKKPYSSHDGYDFAKKSQANYNDPQLAAADGIATFHKDFWQQGNAIYIDHGNRFQTRYYHLDPKDLISSETGKTVGVKQGQVIGRIGYTGNVDPLGEDGAHIHFMLIFDKNNDGNFDDNIPDGIMDPYGWMGKEGEDPWENALFQYPFGTPRTGMKSRYMWKYDLMSSKLLISENNKSGLINGEGFDINIDELVKIGHDKLEFSTRIIPAEVRTIDGANREKLGVVIDLVIKDGSGEYVRYLNNPFNLVIDLLRPDIKESIKPESVKIMSSQDDGITWVEEDTVIDWENKKAMANINHATLFTVVGEKKDVSAPTTTLTASGTGKGNVFRSDVALSMQASDPDANSMGIEYTLFTQDSDYEWQQYLSPVSIATEGAHFVKAFSADKSNNIEIAKIIEFEIDKTVPEIGIKYATESGKFEFQNVDIKNLDKAPQLRDDGMGKVVVEDDAGNVNELQYQEYSDDGLQTFRVIGGGRNDDVINYKPSVYGIASEDMEVEFLRSGEYVTRVVKNEEGKRMMINSDGIVSDHARESPLQMITESDRLVLLNSE